MAQGTQLIYTDQPGPLAAEYTLPPNLDLTLQSIVARIDGSGAAASFYPTLSVYTSDNRLMYRVRADQLFLAGDTGVVTWSPFLRSQQAQTAQGKVFGCYLQISANVAFADGFVFLNILPWDVEVFDTDNMHDNAVNPTRITFNTAGVYLIKGQINVTTSTAGDYGIAIDPNGAGGPSWASTAEVQLGANGNYHAAIECVALYVASVGEYVELVCEQKTGGGLTIDKDSTNFWAVRMGDTP